MTALSARLEAIETRANQATEGPWAVMDVNDPGEGVNFIDVYAETDGLETVTRMPDPAGYSMRDYLQADAEFIAHARTDVPFLLSVARGVEAVRALAEALIENQPGDPDSAFDRGYAAGRRAAGGMVLATIKALDG